MAGDVAGLARSEHPPAEWLPGAGERRGRKPHRGGGGGAMGVRSRRRAAGRARCRPVSHRRPVCRTGVPACPKCGFGDLWIQGSLPPRRLKTELYTSWGRWRCRGFRGDTAVGQGRAGSTRRPGLEVRQSRSPPLVVVTEGAQAHTSAGKLARCPTTPLPLQVQIVLRCGSDRLVPFPPSGSSSRC